MPKVLQMSTMSEEERKEMTLFHTVKSLTFGAILTIGFTIAIFVIACAGVLKTIYDLIAKFCEFLIEMGDGALDEIKEEKCRKMNKLH